MNITFVEATNGFNWGKFAIGRFDADELIHPSAIEDEDMGVSASLVRSRGWGSEHFWFMDLQTGEAAMFRHGGLARADLNKHRIHVCPMAEPALVWIYAHSLDDLPPVIRLTEAEAPSSMQGFRRPGPLTDDEAVEAIRAASFEAPKAGSHNEWSSRIKAILLAHKG